MDKYNYYFEMLVSETHLDNAFDWVEAAMWKTRASALLARTSGVAHGAIHVGADVVQNAAPDLNVIVEAGACTDPTGRNVEWTSDQTVDCSVDYLGNPTAVGSPGNERYLGIFAFFDQEETDTVIDGNGLEVQSKINEWFLIRVYVGTEAGAGTANPPATPADSIRLANVILAYGTTTILNADIEYDTTNYLRDDYIRVAGVNLADLVYGNPSDAIEQLFVEVDSLVVGTGITFSGNQNWHDASGVLSSTDVSGAINEIVEDLAEDNAGAGGEWGSDKIGSNEYTTTYGNADLTRGSVSDQLRESADTVDDFIQNFVDKTNEAGWITALCNWITTDDTPSVAGSDQPFIFHKNSGMLLHSSVTAVYACYDGLYWDATEVYNSAYTHSRGCAESYNGTLLLGTTTGDIEYTTDPAGSWSQVLAATIGGGASDVDIIRVKDVATSDFTAVVINGSIRMAPTGWASGTWVSPTTPPTAGAIQSLIWLKDGTAGGGSKWFASCLTGSTISFWVSNDDCDTWTVTSSVPTYPSELENIEASDYNPETGTIIVVGGKDAPYHTTNAIVRTVDDGDTWTNGTFVYKCAEEVYGDAYSLYDVKHVYNDVWIACGVVVTSSPPYTTNILVSIDDGNTWNMVKATQESVTEPSVYLIATDDTRYFLYNSYRCYVSGMYLEI